MKTRTTSQIEKLENQNENTIKYETRRITRSQMKKRLNESENSEDESDFEENEDSLHSSSEESNDIIQCICGNNFSRGEMVQCDSCKIWQHIDCLGFKSGNDLPDFYFCQKCKSKFKKQNETEPFEKKVENNL
eukprot:Anaeramoba_ignava/a484393_15.p1 GENE.a484393_15~~a484393_15.p1  ORF type:complete len:142 (-),score=52.47 a484393_15:67-465(-)